MSSNLSIILSTIVVVSVYGSLVISTINDTVDENVANDIMDTAVNDIEDRNISDASFGFTTTTLTTTSASIRLYCADDEFQCHFSQECIPRLWECDHKIDCVDGSDELPHITEQDSMESGDSVRLVKYCNACGTQYFRCRISNECIPKGWLCDDQKDCGENDNSDEENDICQSIADFLIDTKPRTSNQTRNPLTTPEPMVVLHNQTHFHSLIRSFSNVSTSNKMHSASNKDMDITSMLTIIRESMICWLNKKITSIECAPTTIFESLTDPVNEQLEPKSSTVPPKETFLIPTSIDATAITKIAFDWLTDNWYLLDSKNELIYLCSHHFEQCIVVMDYHLLTGALSIELDATEGLLFVSRRGDKSRIDKQSIGPAILKANFDGSHSTVLVDIRLLEPAYLSLDASIRRIYWIDTQLELLEYVDYDGNNRHKIRDSSNNPWSKVVSMFVNDNRIYLLSLRQRFVDEEEQQQQTFVAFSTMDLTRNVTSKQMIQMSSEFSSAKIVYSMAYMQVSKLIKLLCVKCHKQLCIPKFDHTVHQTITAECVNRTLTDVIQVPVLVYSRGQPGLIQLRPLENFTSNNESHKYTSITISQCPIGFDIDPLTRTIYSTDDCNGNLNAVKMFASNDPIERLNWKQFGVKRVESIAVDWIGQNLYVVDGDNGDILIKSLRNATLIKRIKTNLISPKMVVLDLKHYKMFYSQYGNVPLESFIFEADSIGAKIESSNLDGSQTQTLVASVKLKFPNGLSVDSSQQKLYWCDAFYKRLESINYDGTNRVIVLQSARIGIATSLYFFQNSLYWTELQHGILQKYDLNTKQSSIVLHEKAPLYQVMIFDHSDIHFVNNTEINCEQFSILNPHGQYQCACDDNYRLNSTDQRSCFMLKQCQSDEQYCDLMNSCVSNDNFNITCMDQFDLTLMHNTTTIN